MSTALDQVRRKVRWARARTDALDAIGDAFIKSDFYTIALEQNKQGWLVSKFDRVDPFPLEYAILIGEIAHHLRSALDHIAFALANPRSAREEQHVKFPLCSTSERFKSQKSASLVGAPRGVLGLVESMQPYHRRKWPETRFLGQLQAIQNWDKHRALAVAAAAIAEVNVELRVIGKTSIKHHAVFGGRVKGQKVISRTMPGYSEVSAKIDYHPNFSLYPAFDKGSPREVECLGVRGILTGAGHFIESEVLPRFERFF